MDVRYTQAMDRPETLLVSHAVVTHVLTMRHAMDAVTQVMTAHGLSDVIAPNLLHADTPKGEFHIKTGGMMTGETTGVFGLKANGGFFQNHALGLPNILGVIVLADAETGCTLAVLDSTEISRIRTGAATAVAARQLARPDSRTLAVVGTGVQAKTQIEALCQVLPIEHVRLVGRDVHRTKHRASVIETQVGVAVEAVGDIGAATRHSDVVVTCTPARAPLVGIEDITPGTFIAAVGADSPGKQELDARLTARCTAVADVLHQCVHVGELQHPIRAGLLTEVQVHGEIGQILCGARPGRTTDEDITLYDSTGTALQDVAVGFAVYQEALAQQLGVSIQLGA